MLDGRRAVIKALGAYRKNGAWPDIYIENLIKNGSISDIDIPFVNRVTLGTLENRFLLNYYIEQFSDIPVKKLHPIVLDIMQMSVYQLVFLGNTHSGAIVNEAVALTKKEASVNASKYVNAVLRKIAAVRNNMPEIKAENNTKYLSIKYTFPEWFIEKLEDEIGDEETERFLKISNTKAPITIHTNTLKCGKDELEASLKSDGIQYKICDNLPNSFEIVPDGAITGYSFFKDNLAYVQDNSAFCVSYAADIKKGQSIIDVCAAPGGKTVTSAMLTENSGLIVACDIHEKKLRRIIENVTRMGISAVETAACDARAEKSEFLNRFDAVIADVPCSGFGVIRKKPEIKFKSDDETRGLCKIQADILRNAAKYAKPGGVVIYSTCTVLKRENEDIVNDFLKNTEGYSLEPFRVGNFCDAPNGYVTLWPQRNGSDGFFIAKIRRNK